MLGICFLFLEINTAKRYLSQGRANNAGMRSQDLLMASTTFGGTTLELSDIFFARDGLDVFCICALLSEDAILNVAVPTITVYE